MPWTLQSGVGGPWPLQSRVGEGLYSVEWSGGALGLAEWSEVSPRFFRVGWEEPWSGELIVLPGHAAEPPVQTR